MHDWVLYAVVVLALLFDFVNGFHDTANSIATSIMTNAIKIQYAILMAAILNFIGAIINTKVAHTIGTSIVDASMITPYVLIVALFSAIIWNIVTWRLGIPTSSSHAIIGSLLGVALATKTHINISGVKTIVTFLILSPCLGLISGFISMICILWLFRNKNRSRLNNMFRKIQIFTAAAMSLGHGGNDAQKSMGIITMALVAHGYIKGDFHVPTWVVLSCAIAMALGTACGGWKIIKTVGKDIMKIKPVQGFAADIGNSIIIWTATAIGLPVSTSQIVSAGISGVGFVDNINKVNFRTMINIVTCWFITIPLTGILAYLIYKIFVR